MKTCRIEIVFNGTKEKLINLEYRSKLLHAPFSEMYAALKWATRNGFTHYRVKCEPYQYKIETTISWVDLCCQAAAFLQSPASRDVVLRHAMSPYLT